MEDFRLPLGLQEILDQNHTFSGLARSCLSQFGVWLKRNNVRFFTEYTDHSLEHVEDTLATADQLIREECRGIVRPADVATLIVAALLHDCAMHLSADGFVALVHGNGEGGEIIEGFRDQPWSKLWEDFLAEARRFSGRRLMALFGDTEPVQYPPLDPQKMTGRDLLLIGEFLRRHHHRLAHEIALFGVPGPTDERLKLLSTQETEHIVDLAGVVARSHGMAIRECFDYLRGRYSSVKVIRGIHPVYLMALLRIADLLQIQSERAPRQVLQVQRMRSTDSIGEWEMHSAIKDVNCHEYPETIFIEARPPDVRTYLRVKVLLDRIQRELDSSWTIIGELYGYDPQFREFGLTIRRVRSNLDDEEAFAKRVEYIPCDASFEVADTDLLKLLIGPLYGHRPQIGIRELVQNAVDAVRELDEYRNQHPAVREIQLTPQDGDVVVSIDQEKDGACWVTVSDRGIGMDLQTIREYFLKAGASVRRSEIWRKTFEDDEGKSRVLRSGRFGVGALATFLLGDEIHVSTRHVTAAGGEGIEFSAQLDTEAIELRRAKRPVGTTIRVRIGDEVKDELLGEWDEKKEEWRRASTWDWYCLAEPRVARAFDHGTKHIQQEYELPPLESALPAGWHRIRHPDYRDIHWSYGRAPGLTCNGIMVCKAGQFIGTQHDQWERGDLWRGQFVRVKSPGVSLFDFDAKLPLNLQRTSMTVDGYPFDSELLDDVLRDFVAHAIVTAPSKPLTDPAARRWHAHLAHPAPWPRVFGQGALSILPWFSTAAGACFALDPWHIAEANVDQAIVLAPLSTVSQDMERIITLSPSLAVFGLHTYSLRRLFESRTYYDSAVDHGLDLRDLVDSELIVPVMAVASVSGYLPVLRVLRSLLDWFPEEWVDRVAERASLSYGALEHHVLPGKRVLFHAQILGWRDPSQIPAWDDYDGRHGRARPPSDRPVPVVEWTRGDWILWRIGECPEPRFDFARLVEEVPTADAPLASYVIVERYLKEERPDVEPSPLARVWRDVVGTPIIPYDPQERRDKLAHAYEELAPYIEAHEALARAEEERLRRAVL